MGYLKDILGELKQEATVTRKHLEKVDFDQADYRPHEKSEKMGRLAIHIAEIVAWWKNVMENKELNFIDFKPMPINSNQELLDYFDDLLSSSTTTLSNADEKELNNNWSMKYGDEVLFTLNKKEVLRKFCINHLIHHRAQLGVYLRLLDIEVPAVYGPSADDERVILIEKFCV